MIEINKEYIKNTSRDVRREHLDLNDECIERGGNSTNHKGILAQFLDTTIPAGRILLCHACNNPKCSNLKHLYWGSDYDNHIDAKEHGIWKNPWENLVGKYGLEKARQIQGQKQQSKAGKANKGKPKSEEHKRKISESLKRKNNE